MTRWDMVEIPVANFGFQIVAIGAWPVGQLALAGWCAFSSVFDELGKGVQNGRPGHGHE